MYKKVSVLVALRRMVTNYVRVCRDGVIPTKELHLALMKLTLEGLSKNLIALHAYISSDDNMVL